MKITQQILDKIETLGIRDKFNFKRTIQIKKRIPEYLRKATNKHEIVILGNEDILDFYNQPLVVIPLNDFLMMLVHCILPKPHKRRKQKVGENEAG